MVPIVLTDEQKQNLLEWAGWLETTTLKQGKGQLCHHNQYCCLGVYASLKHPELWKYDSIHKSGYIEASPEGGENEETVLPPEIAKELGIEVYIEKIKNGKEHYVHVQSIFVAMNDRFDLSFAEIAQEVQYFVETGLLPEPILEHF